MVKRVVFGEIKNPKVNELKDLDRREFGVLLGVAAGVLIIGVWPAPLLEIMEASVDQLLAHLAVSKL